MKTIECLFCRTSAERGKEHVFSNALLKKLGACRDVMLFEKRSSCDDGLEESRQHSYDALRAGGICKSCNEGWMSALEATVLPWILQVGSSDDLKSIQHPSRRLTFARWAVKTACVIGHIGGMQEIPNHVPRQLIETENSLPENVRVLIGFHNWPAPTRFTFTQRNRWTHYPLNQPCRSSECQMEGMFFKVAFSVERLMVLVVGTPSAHFHPVIGTGVHVPIWPDGYIPNHHWFYALKLEGCNAEQALRNFSDLFAVAHAGRMS